MAGHFGPLLPFIEAMRGGGHDVLVVTPEPARARAEATGVRVLVGGSPDRVELDQLWLRFRAAEPGEASVIANREIFGRLNTEAMLPSVARAVAEHRPELVVHESTEYAGPIMALRASIPHAQVLSPWRSPNTVRSLWQRRSSKGTGRCAPRCKPHRT